jgi:hypothetical protein
MTHVVERCPSCGVEHDVSADSLCEACDTPLRLWCSRHGRETGWLEAAGCPRCAEELARPPAASPPPSPRPVRRPAAPAPVRAAPGPASARALRRRTLREVLGDHGIASGPALGFGGTVKRLLRNLGVSVLFGVGGTGLLISLLGLVSLLGDDALAAPLHIRVPGLAFGLIGSLIVLAVALNAVQRWRD